MVIFKKNQFEVALVTYNRKDFVNEYLRMNYEGFRKRNIKVSIYDSSTNNETEELISSLGLDLIYYRIDSRISVGYKPMLPIINTNCEYLWVAGDSKYFTFEDLDSKVFNRVLDSFDVIILRAGPKVCVDETIYNDKSKFLFDCFISTTCVGHSIYKMKIFDRIRNDKQFLKTLDDKYKSNYGFSWLGYFYESLALGNYNSIYIDINQIPILSNSKKQSWIVKFYECWIENIISIMNYLPCSYLSKKNVPAFVWKKMKLDRISYCALARFSGGLDYRIIKQYDNFGYLDIINAKKYRLIMFSIMPKFVAKFIYILSIMLNKFKINLIKIIKCSTI